MQIHHLFTVILIAMAISCQLLHGKPYVDLSSISSFINIPGLTPDTGNLQEEFPSKDQSHSEQRPIIPSSSIDSNGGDNVHAPDRQAEEEQKNDTVKNDHSEQNSSEAQASHEKQSESSREESGGDTQSAVANKISDQGQGKESNAVTVPSVVANTVNDQGEGKESNVVTVASQNKDDDTTPEAPYHAIATLADAVNALIKDTVGPLGEQIPPAADEENGEDVMKEQNEQGKETNSSETMRSKDTSSDVNIGEESQEKLDDQQTSNCDEANGINDVKQKQLINLTPNMKIHDLLEDHGLADVFDQTKLLDGDQQGDLSLELFILLIFKFTDISTLPLDQAGLYKKIIKEVCQVYAQYVATAQDTSETTGGLKIPVGLEIKRRKLIKKLDVGAPVPLPKKRGRPRKHGTGQPPVKKPKKVSKKTPPPQIRPPLKKMIIRLDNIQPKLVGSQKRKPRTKPRPYIQQREEEPINPADLVPIDPEQPPAPKVKPGKISYIGEEEEEKEKEEEEEEEFKPDVSEDEDDDQDEDYVPEDEPPDEPITDVTVSKPKRPRAKRQKRSSTASDDDKVYNCDMCEKVFHKKKNLWRHKQRHILRESGKREYTCQRPGCGEKLTSWEAMKAHRAMHPKIVHQCETCDKVLSSNAALIAHTRTHTGEKPFKCDQCDKTFAQQQSLVTHLLIHAGIKEFVCDICGKQFVDNASLKLHMRLHTGDLPYSCEICGKRFAQSCNLRKHTWRHTGYRPHHCPYCSMQFMRLDRMQAHMCTHTGEMPYTCSTCGKQFSHIRYLKRHEMTHTGERPYKCSVCEKAFRREHHLTVHLRRHRGERPFGCKYCEKRFTESHDCKRHEMTHTGEKPHVCADCGKSFYEPRTLRKHEASQHGKVHPSPNKAGIIAPVNQLQQITPAQPQILQQPVDIQVTIPMPPMGAAITTSLAGPEAPMLGTHLYQQADQQNIVVADNHSAYQGLRDRPFQCQACQLCFAQLEELSQHMQLCPKMQASIVSAVSSIQAVQHPQWMN